MWNTVKHTKIGIMGVPGVDKREKGAQKINNAENSPNLMKNINVHIQEAQAHHSENAERQRKWWK